MTVALTVALSLIGITASFVVIAYGVARVIRRHRTVGDYGTVPVPGQTKVTLSGGRLDLTYQESRRARVFGDCDIDFRVPAGLKVVVTSPSGQELPIRGIGPNGTGSRLSTGPGFSRAQIGTVDATEAGAYTVTATTPGDLHGAVKPEILLGSGT